MKKAQKRNLVIMSLVCVILAAVYFMIPGWFEKDEDTGNTAVYRIEEDEISHITFGKDEPITLVRKEDCWFYEEDESFPLNQAFVQTMLEKTAELTVLRQVAEGEKEYASYGLLEPSNIISLETATQEKTKPQEDATSRTIILYLGAVNSATGAGYLRVEGSEKIYSVDSSFVNIFSNDLLSMAARDTVPGLLPDEVDKIEVCERENGIRVTRQADENETGSRKWIVSMLQNGKEKGSARAADDEAAVGLITSLINLRFHRMVYYKPDQEQLEACGLLTPEMTIEVVWDGKNDYILLIGENADEENVYAYTQENKAVYLLDGKLASPFRGLSLSDFLTLDIAPVLPEDLEHFRITMKGRTAVYDLLRTDEEITGALLNGKEISVGEFNAVYYQIYALIGEKRLDDISETLTEDPVITFIFERKPAAGGILTVEIIPYDQNYYAVRTDGRAEILMNRKTENNLEKLLEKIPVK